MTRARSAELFQKANRHLVGGVNSPVRAFKGVGGDPIFFAEAKGAYVTDADGNRYIDYVQTWGPAILGHAQEDVVAAIAAQAQKGTSFGAPCEAEIELAELVNKAVPSLEKMRFVSSGTEATMSALRLARGATGKDGILKCEGCYHGHADSLLVKAGSGVSTLGLPDSPGVPADLAKHTFNVPYNDLEALDAMLEEAGDKIACFILEPVAGNMGCVPPVEGYLKGARELCTKHGVLLIFDEVMTGFRVALGGAQARFGITPDLSTFGKVIGGGLPVGAFGGSKDIMSKLAPEGAVYQAGTLSGNPLAMAAGIETISRLFEDGLYDKLEATTTTIAHGIADAAKAAGVDASPTVVGSMFSVHLRPEVPTNYHEVKEGDAALFGRYFWEMIDRGVYLAPSAFESGFVSVCHGDDEVQKTLEAAKEAFAAAKAS
jgi:glutamate-1-semialdehyde 2,1-aminomutase